MPYLNDLPQLPTGSTTYHINLNSQKSQIMQGQKYHLKELSVFPENFNKSPPKKKRLYPKMKICKFVNVIK